MEEARSACCERAIDLFTRFRNNSEDMKTRVATYVSSWRLEIFPLIHARRRISLWQSIFFLKKNYFLRPLLIIFNMYLVSF
jgi:hypothetical protein